MSPSSPTRSIPEQALSGTFYMACVNGPDLGVIIPLTCPVTVGRDADIRLTTREASRLHCRINPCKSPHRHSSLHEKHSSYFLRRNFHKNARATRRNVCAEIEDLHSTNGTYILRKHFPYVVGEGRRIRCAIGGKFILKGNDRLRIVDDVFEVRKRPHVLQWPDCTVSSTRRGFFSLSFLFMSIFIASRLPFFTENTRMILACIAFTLILITVISAYVWIRQKKRWDSYDCAYLTLVACTLKKASRIPKALLPLAEHWEGSIWLEGNHRYPTWNVEAGEKTSSLSHKAGTRIPLLSRLMGQTEEIRVSCPGAVGVYALEEALWWSIQIAVRAGGATITCGHSILEKRMRQWSTPVSSPIPQQWILGTGKIKIHITSQDSGNPKIFLSENDQISPHIRIGIAQSYSRLPHWCDALHQPKVPHASMGWWWQLSSCVDETIKGNLIPDMVEFSDLEALPSPADSNTLKCPIGCNKQGIVHVDLVKDGPHALVAGTTGAGKSEALITWLLSLCQRFSPQQLRLILIDYKGGSSFNDLANLPHVEDVLTDLAPHRTDRALRGIAALLRQREKQFAHLGVPDLSRWQDEHAKGKLPFPPPRVVIAIDEFRVLGETHPHALDSLVRLSSQGRSLGLHLIAATQRPSGAISAAMKTNMELRLALRCSDDSDSLDVLGSSDAAKLPRIPGRAVLRDGGLFQVAWARDISKVVQDIHRRWNPLSVPLSTSLTRSSPLWAPDLPTDLTFNTIRSSYASSYSNPRDQKANTELITPIGLIDGIDHGAHRILSWRGENIRFEAPQHQSENLKRCALNVGKELSQANDLPLYVVNDDESLPNSEWISFISIRKPSALIRLLVEIHKHGPALIVIGDAEETINSLDENLGPGQGRALWSRTLSQATSSNVTFIVATPGILGYSSGVGSHFPLRCISAADETDALRAGVAPNPSTNILGRYILRNSEDNVDSQAPSRSGGRQPFEKIVQFPMFEKPTSLSACSHPRISHAWKICDFTSIQRPPSSDCLGFVGSDMRPFIISAPAPWVICSDSPSQASDLLTRIFSDQGWAKPLIVDKTAYSSFSHPSISNTQINTSIQSEVGSDCPTITLISPHRWNDFHIFSHANFLALDPSPQTTHTLMKNSVNANPALRCEQWNKSCGIILCDGLLERIRLALPLLY